ncbi:gamma-glutamyltransferase [Thalassobaculum fulvum]|uniref:Glutathione hydrolase proenzyme n=1 Tax=Thalassobaculum fulvum TaxID=1633335 RepID=A0A919CPR5_9PROT|nr:gamma-glutamyltransferase [Thalassobaculum fulvum]GHD48743.1 gamma-glutamyltransferase [Thalassobaculum fulvum]
MSQRHRLPSGPGPRLGRRAFLAGGGVLAGGGLALLGPAFAAGASLEAPALDRGDRIIPAEARYGMVASREATATRVGVDVLAAGGNAIDAAVATAFALAVTLPQAGNLGGGGFLLVRPADGSAPVALDFRETAPGRAWRELFIGPDGEVDKRLARYSHRSVGVPGSVAGYADALARWGTWPLDRVIEPAIALARDGFPMTRALARDIARSHERLSRWPQSKVVVARADGGAYLPGEIFRQPDLANTLALIARDGPDGFYRGPIAVAIADEMRRHDGLIDEGDLAEYRTVLREPVRGTYRGVEVVSMPPPSSGGALLIQMLNVLEGWPIAELGFGSAATLHRMAETMRRAYADRFKHIADPAFHDVPLAGLVSKDYAASLRQGIDLQRATESSALGPGEPKAYESDNTTHLSVMDRDGTAVALTTTLNFAFGTGIVAEGTGIFLNNEMDDFAARPGAANAYGLVQGEENAVEAGKRPLSSMAPTLVLDGPATAIATGGQGGSRIITSVLQFLVNTIDHGMNLAEATLAPRIHHQWLPDELRIEEGFSPDTAALLEAMGHRVVRRRSGATVQNVRRVAEGYRGFADPRRPGGLAAGPD